MTDSPQAEHQDPHGGEHAVAVAAAHGVDTLFTLSGAHVFPMYDGALHADPPMRILDVRHEQTAVFAAEAVGKLTGSPGWRCSPRVRGSPTASARSPRRSSADPRWWWSAGGP